MILSYLLLAEFGNEKGGLVYSVGILVAGTTHHPWHPSSLGTCHRTIIRVCTTGDARHKTRAAGSFRAVPGTTVDRPDGPCKSSSSPEGFHGPSLSGSKSRNVRSIAIRSVCQIGSQTCCKDENKENRWLAYSKYNHHQSISSVNLAVKMNVPDHGSSENSRRGVNNAKNWRSRDTGGRRVRPRRRVGTGSRDPARSTL